MTQLWSAPVDLDNCAAEPIHIPGAIQPHGVLLAVTEPALEVVVASANVGAWLGPTDPIGEPLERVVGAENRAAIDAARTGDWVQRRDDVELWLGSRPLVATLHRADGLLVIEIEAVDSIEPGAASIVREAAMALQIASSVVDVAAQAARWVRSLTGFDRVMVYRFDRGVERRGHRRGQARRPQRLPGPALPGDRHPGPGPRAVPAQLAAPHPGHPLHARPLEPPVGFDSRRPLDLSSSTLRSVSPIHVEYLSNMGVDASMSVSIVVQGELWGLIACHHYSGRTVPTSPPATPPSTSPS